MQDFDSINKLAVRLAGWLLLIVLCSCATPTVRPTATHPMIGRQLWTATNLRLYHGQYVYWYNHLHGNILPVGTPIRIIDVTQQTAVLMDNNNTKYVLYWQEETGKREFSKEVAKYCQPQNPKSEIAKWNEQEQEAIGVGEIRRGMSKKQVLLSCGYPEDMDNPWEHDTWLYWTNPRQKLAIRFGNDVVVEIVK